MQPEVRIGWLYPCLNEFYLENITKIRMVCDTFKHSPVYRIGGDEFVAVLFGADYTNRQPLLEQLKTDFERTYEQTDVTPWERYSASAGMAEKASDDLSSEFVFRRADAAMYKDKARFKKKYNMQQSR